MSSSLWVNGGIPQNINPINNLRSSLGTTWGHLLNGVLAEETTFVRIYDAGTISHLGIHILENPGTFGSVVTVALRKNGVATGLSVTVGAGLTGYFVNNSATVTVAPGDDIDIRYDNSNFDTVVSNMTSAIFTPTNTNICVTQVGTIQTSAWLGIGSGTTRYVALHGLHSEGSGTQAERQDCVPIDSTAKNARVRIIANTLNGATTATLQKNGVDTAISITFAAGESGWKEHTANTVAFAAHDVAGWKIVTAGSSGGITLVTCAVQFHSENAEWFLGLGQQLRTPAGTTTDLVIGGDNWPLESEARQQWSATLGGRCKGLCINIRVNSAVAESTLRFRKNTANGSTVVPIPAGQTGFFDAAGDDTWTGADLLSLRLTQPGGGQLTYSTIDWIGSFEFEEEEESTNAIDCPHGSYKRTINLTASYVPTVMCKASYGRTIPVEASYGRTVSARGSYKRTIPSTGSF